MLAHATTTPREYRLTTHLFRAADLAQLPESISTHQFNAQAIRHVRTLTHLAGLSRIGLHVVRLKSGNESTEPHTHDNDEEFLIVLAGRGKAEIGESTYDIEAGDIMAFPRGSPAHSLSNPFDDDLVYVMGGERNKNDVVHYPRLKRSMVKTAGRRYWSNWTNQHELPEKF